MIPAAFDYMRADSTDAAIAALVEHGDEAKLLAGGHSLLPLMKLRLASPSVLVDIGRLRDLSYVRDGGDHVAVGGLTRHRDLETSELLATDAPLLRHEGRPHGQEHGRQVGRRVAVGDRSADGAAVAHLRVAHLAGGVSQERRLRGEQRAHLEVAVPGEAADGHVVTAVPDVGQLLQPADVDEHGRGGEAELHQRDERVPAGEELGLLAVLGQRGDGGVR